MFAVPGFRSLTSAPAHQTVQSAEKSQLSGANQLRPLNGDASTVRDTSRSLPSKQTKKRKRGDALLARELTEDNLDELWKDFVQKKTKHDAVGGGGLDNTAIDSSKPQQQQGHDRIDKKQKKKKRKQNGEQAQSLLSHGDAPRPPPPPNATDNHKSNVNGDPNRSHVSHRIASSSSLSLSGNTNARIEKTRTIQEDEEEQHVLPKSSSRKAINKTSSHSSPQSPPLPSGLTPLQQKMRLKLSSARFRHLNQLLYTTPSAESLQLFKEQPEMFDEYHAGFRQQVEAWPENPVDVFISRIKARAGLRDSGHRRDRQVVSSEWSPSPLPRGSKEGHSMIVDLGCGDAAIARAVTSMKPHPKIRITSYDLHAPNKFVTVADIGHLPLESSSVDVAIFCLALMGTNWPDMVGEAARVVRVGGELWIAEIKSRFARGKGEIIDNSQQQQQQKDGKKNKKGKNKKNKDDLENPNPEDAFVEERVGASSKPCEGEEMFIKALSRRGLKLKSRDASNKMFVLMEFEKLPPPKATATSSSSSFSKHSQPNIHGRVSMKFLDSDDKIENESSILKPCVYKLR